VTAAGRDKGFTLIEVTVVIAILAVVALALGTSVIQIFKTNTGVVARVTQSHDANLLSTYLDPDLASAGLSSNFGAANMPGTFALPAGSVVPVSTGGTACSGQTNLLVVEWAEEQPSPGTPPGPALLKLYQAAYDEENIATGGPPEYVLRRYYCTATSASYSGGPLPSFSLADTTTVAHNLTAPTSVPPPVQVTIGAGQPTPVTLTVNENDPAVGAYSFSVSGTVQTRIS